MTPEQVLEVIAKHEGWLQRKSGGERADLSGFDLSGFQLSRLNLQSVRLSGTNLSGSLLTATDLSYADMFCANLDGAELRDSIMTRADLRAHRSEMRIWPVRS